MDPSKGKFEFERYGPGKSHVGTSTDGEGALAIEDGLVVAAAGIAKTSSVSTGIDGLDKHLLTSDFFDVELHPEIKFESSLISDTSTTGALTFHGVTKEITFASNRSSSTYAANFVLDTTPFNFDHAATNDEARIAFDFKI